MYKALVYEAQSTGKIRLPPITAVLAVIGEPGKIPLPPITVVLTIIGGTGVGTMV